MSTLSSTKNLSHPQRKQTQTQPRDTTNSLTQSKPPHHTQRTRGSNPGKEATNCKARGGSSQRRKRKREEMTNASPHTVCLPPSLPPSLAYLLGCGVLSHGNGTRRAAASPCLAWPCPALRVGRQAHSNGCDTVRHDATRGCGAHTHTLTHTHSHSLFHYN